MVYDRTEDLLVAGGRHAPQSSASAQFLGSRPKEAQHLARRNAIGCGHMRVADDPKRVLKNVMQIARKPCFGMGTGVVSLLQGFCRVWLSK